MGTKMNKRISTIFLLTLITYSLSFIDNSRSSENNFPSFEPNTKDSSQSGRSYRKIENKAFGVGEELNFDVNYGFVTAGTAKMSIPASAKIFDRNCYQVVFTVESKPFFDWVYKVRDRYETYIDMEGLFPWKFEQHIREGGYKRDFYVTFDQERGIANTPDGNYTIPAFVQDMFSAYYFARTINYDGFRVGQKMMLKNFYKDSTYNLGVKFLGRQEIKVDAGRFKTIIVEPLITEGGLFKATGRIFIWMTDDDRKMPVQVEAEIPIGSITSKLTSYKGTRGPVPARIGDK